MPRRTTRPGRAGRWLALCLGVATLLPSTLVIPDAVAATSATGIRGVDFRGVDHGIDRATSAIAVEAVRHDDLDGDGAEEAVVVLGYDTAHGREWAVQAYRGTADGAEPAARTHAFHSSWERFDRIDVRDGIIEFTVRTGDAASPDGWLDVHRWAFVEGDLRLLERVSGGALHTLDSAGPTAPAVIDSWFTRSYLDVAPGGERRGVIVETAETKTLRMRADHRDAQVRVYDTQSGRLIGRVGVGETTTLAGAGNWYVEPVTAADRWTRLELTVADLRAIHAPELAVRQFEYGHDRTPGEPRRSVSMSWYEVTWSHGPADLDRVNALIRGVVDSIRSEHEAAAEQCEDGTDATLYVGTTPELVSYDLVSFRFTIASCLCETNDEVVERSITIDLATATLIEGEALLGDRAAVERAWWQVHEEHAAYRALDVGVSVGAPLAVSSVLVRADGVLIGVPAETLVEPGEPDEADEAAEGSTDGWTLYEYLPFDEHPGLLADGLQQRAESGRDVSLPHHGCGC